jgi:hypothetical protein
MTYGKTVRALPGRRESKQFAAFYIEQETLLCCSVVCNAEEKGPTMGVRHTINFGSTGAALLLSSFESPVQTVGV